MVRQGDHRLLLGEVDAHHAIVVGHLARAQLLVVLRTTVELIVLADLLVRHPDRAQTGGLGSHHVDAVAEIDRKVGDAGAGKLQHLVLDKATLEDCLDQRDGDVVGTDTVARRALKPNEDHLRGVDVPGVAEELLDKLTTTLADTHVAQRAIAGVGIGTENHIAALHHLLAGKLVNDGLVGGYVDTAVFLCCRKTKDVVVLIDGTTDGAQRVVAVGHGVRQGELRQAAGASRLNDTYIRNVVRHHRIKADVHLLALATIDVMGTQNAVGDGVLTSLVGRGHTRCILNHLLAVEQIHSMFDQFNHNR